MQRNVLNKHGNALRCGMTVLWLVKMAWRALWLAETVGVEPWNMEGSFCVCARVRACVCVCGGGVSSRGKGVVLQPGGRIRGYKRHTVKKKVACYEILHIRRRMKAEFVCFCLSTMFRPTILHPHSPLIPSRRLPIRDLRPPPPLKCLILLYGLLRVVRRFTTDVSGQPIVPIFKG